MANYLRAELYKVSRRKYTYGLFLFLLVGAALLVSIWAFTDAIGFADAVGISGNLMSMGFYLTIATGDLAFSDQYKFNTLKNEVSYGVPRVRLYLGKLATSCIVALAAAVVVIGLYLGLSWAILPHDPTRDGVMLREAGKMLVGLLPLWLGAQAVSFFFLSSFKSATAASFAFLGLIMGLPQVLKLLSYFVNPWFAQIERFLLVGAYGAMPLWGDWAVGGAWFLGATALGLAALSKREIS